MKLLTYLLVFFFLIEISNAILINEILANPLGDITDESLNEWIELYNNESFAVNVSSWTIGDDSGNDSIEGGLYGKEGTVIEAFGFAIITDDSTRVYNNFNVSEDAVRLYVDDGSIGGGLINTGETFYLYDQFGALIDRKTYNATTDGLSWAFVNDSLHISNPTPGFSNDGSVISNQGCDYAVEFILLKTIFDNSSDFSFQIQASKIKGTPTNFTMRAEIEDINGKFIRDYKPFTNQSISFQRTSTKYTPNLEEGKSYILYSNITTQCNDTNLENNFDTRIITIKGKPLREDSSIDIERIYDLGADNEAKFGQTVRIKLNVYKGNTNKKSVAIWIEDNKDGRLSKQTKTNLEQKYTNYSLTLPIQIKPNCDEKFKDDDYTIVARGLDSEDEEEIEIADLTDSLCEVKIIENKKLSSKKFSFEIMDFDKDIYLGNEFTTKIMFDNNNDQDINIKVWSYAYRGSKSYSGEREGNTEEFVLKRNSLQIIELSNVVEEAESGNYKFKVMVNKNNQKTNNQITKDIVIHNNLNKVNSKNLKNNEIEYDNEIGNKITDNVIYAGLVYESTTEKAKNLIPVFLIFLLVLFNIVLIWKR